MSEILGLMLELVLNLVGGVFEALADIWLGDYTGSDSRGARIFWFVVIVLLGVVIWWELH
jgi:hypothetical protein